MRTFAELQADMADMLSVAGLASSFFSDTTSQASYIKKIINKGWERAHGFADWPFMERGLASSTVASTEYYAYPTSPYTFKTNGLIRVEINGENYSKTEFNDYRDYKLLYPNQTDKKIFTDYQRFIFLFPTPTAIQTMDVWGIVKPNVLSVDADTTLFYDAEPDGDEAVLLFAYSIALRKASRIPEAKEAYEEGKELLSVIWDRYKNRKKQSLIERPMLNVPNYFPSRGIRGYGIGTFNN